MRPIDINTASLLLDFEGGDSRLEALGRMQLEGAVALHNMLAEIGFGYLADEVGMGKTYVALGVVTLMRHFNPSLRVLYICPSRNVQEKWYEREYPNFIKRNVTPNAIYIRNLQGGISTPSISCQSIEELIHAATTGYYGDIFVRMSSFSMAMGEEEENIQGHLNWLFDRVPRSVIGNVGRSKESVKAAYAKAINYLLPSFDLVVIDEAHNFKHPFESSDRNKALSRILGFTGEDGFKQRAKRALFLSATPFDLNPAHLFNQLKMVGKGYLLPNSDEWENRNYFKERMKKFMVRRLNVLEIGGMHHTRNMYRREWRKGERAEISFDSAEHKLITALVQKHIGELLNKKAGNPEFQLGLLASFESYAQTSKSGPVEFDGDPAVEGKKDAQDRHLIAAIRDSYVDENRFGKSLPHPKMDQVTREVAELALNNSRKQLVFVRRVKSVNELKQKLDDEYNSWLISHIMSLLAGFTAQTQYMKSVIGTYTDVQKARDEDVSGVEVSDSADEEEHLPPKVDNLFNWFFRGELPSELEKGLSPEEKEWPTPDALRKSLTAKKNSNVLLFEFNWADWVSNKLIGQSLSDLLEAQGGLKEVLARLAISQLVPEDDLVTQFQLVQTAFLEWLAKQFPSVGGISELASYLAPPLTRSGNHRLSDTKLVDQLLQQHGIFGQLNKAGLTDRIFSSPKILLGKMKAGLGGEILRDEIHRVEIHRQLLAQGFRSGHGVIDLYVARLKLGTGELNEERRCNWMQHICELLKNQLQSPAFSTARELELLNENLDLVIKSNLPSVYDRSPSELRIWLNRNLPSSAPVIGANGETSKNRSVQARKFRMPGYPLVLVSTDVFQEGEDLHTFCDSVVHYGLSSSPVSIEQKNGRVDRVGALAHRRLRKIEKDQAIDTDDYIQVSFPFVKQSIEAVQVRKLCANLNVFVGTLHEIGCEGMKIEEVIDASIELLNRNEIPDQILHPLVSPYVPTLSIVASPDVEKRILDDGAKFGASIRHIKELLNQVTSPSKKNIGVVCEIVEGIKEKSFQVQINSARACGEILLRVTEIENSDSADWNAWTTDAVLSLQTKLYQESLYRTYGIRERSGFSLFRDAEMLVGGEEITSKEDMLGLFNRFSNANRETEEVSCLKSAVPAFSDTKVNKYLQSKFHWGGTFSSDSRGDVLKLMFQFNDDRQRKHYIELKASNYYCVFEAMVADRSIVSQFTKEKLLRFTWLRNRNIDLVEFLVRPDGCLIGRTVHPLMSMSFDEFVFSAYVLAVEADRLEYLIKIPDEF